MRFVAGTMVVSLACIASAAQDDAAKKDLAKLQGVWQCVSMEIEGRAQPAANVARLKMTFEGNKATHPGSGGQVEGAEFTLDPSKKPKAIDMVSLNTEKGTKLVGIYEIDGDTLKLCAAKADRSRPSEFKAAKDTVYMVFQREKK